MRYIYDIVLNFEKCFFEFYEWEKNDNIINIKKIPVFFVNNETYKIIKHNSVTVNIEFVDKLRDKTFTYNKIKVGPSCLISNGMEVIGLLFNDKGDVIKKSSLLIDEEEEVLEEITDSDVYVIDIVKSRKIKKDNFNRRDSERRDFLINYINKENNVSNLKYLYYDYFELEENDSNIIKDKLTNEIKNNWNKKFNSFYETVKIINKIKN